MRFSPFHNLALAVQPELEFLVLLFYIISISLHGCVPCQAYIQFVSTHDDAGLAVGQHGADALQIGKQVLAVVGFVLVTNRGGRLLGCAGE